MLETNCITCPYCGEGFDLVVDLSSGSQNYIEDCQVCCRPIEVHIRLDEQGTLGMIEVRRDDE